MICAGSDGKGAARQLARIAQGWRLREVQPPLIVCTYAQTPETILAVVILIQIAFGALLTINDGMLATFLTELFPTKVRFTGFAFSFNSANALFGGTAPFMATWLIGLSGSKLAPAWYLVIAAAVALIAMLMATETAGKPLRD